jgi:AcrR family transcriptional regulator
MTEDVKGLTARRPNRREVAAAETRREILRAARRLFTEHGFAGTSVQQIAEEAGVAVQTIYSSVGSKSALVLALGDLIEEEADALRLNAEISQQTDPRQLIATGVHLTRQLNERSGDILEILFTAASAEPDAAALAAEGMRRHDQGARQGAQRLASLGALAPDMTPERAAAVFAMMTTPASWRQLTQCSGWSFGEAETWLTASLTQLLLANSRELLK